MISEDLARHLNDASADGDFVLVEHDGTGSPGRWMAIWRDDTEAQRWKAQDGEHWFSTHDSDPIDLWQYVKHAKSARLIAAPSLEAPTTWNLPDEPGPDVTAVTDASGSTYNHIASGCWQYRISPTAMERGIKGATFTWAQMLQRGPLADATSKS